jgi:hypothetical protein
VPGVSIEVRRQSGANTIAVTTGQGTGAGEGGAARDVKLVIQTRHYIENALHEINVHLVLGRSWPR